MRKSSPAMNLRSRLGRLPVAIKAALITGAFAIFCALLVFSLNLCLNTSARNGPSKPTSRNELQKPTREAAVSAIKQFYGYCEFPSDKADIGWIDFAGSGRPLEFYVSYEMEYSRLVDVFTIRNGDPEIILRRLGCSEELKAGYITVDGKGYFLISAKTGSGGYLTLEIYEYDGIGKAVLSQEFQDLFYGDMFVSDNRAFVTSSSQKFEVKHESGRFVLVRYLQRLAPPSYGTQVLRLDVKGSALAISFDGKQLTFTKEDEDQYVCTRPVGVLLEGEVFIDDNFGDDGRQVRIMSHGDEFTWHRGFFDSMKPKKAGEATITISDSYEDWYHIRCLVGPEAEQPSDDDLLPN
jgi:hypothetical protein